MAYLSFSIYLKFLLGTCVFLEFVAALLTQLRSQVL